jgi:hypothetical protein
MTTAPTLHAARAPRSRAELVDRYADVSPFVILKTDVQRRGVVYTDRALAQVDPTVHLTQVRSIFSTEGERNVSIPASLLLRDGTSILASPLPGPHEPYVVDHRDGRTVLVDGEEPIEEVEFWYRPRFFDAVTSRGTPMWQVAAMVRPQRIDFNPYGLCHFWDDGKGCRYCSVGAVGRSRASRDLGRPVRIHPLDAYETVREALRQPGRFVSLQFTGGSIPGPDNRFEEEVQGYAELLQAVGEAFATRRFPSQLIASAFEEDQLRRLHERTGLLSYTADLEILDEEKFAWICPGKHARVGYREWKARLVRAVGIFGRGYVNSGFVAGAELAKPHGFTTEDEAIEVTLATAEELAAQGVGTVAQVWRPSPGSAFQKQVSPSLEYYVRLIRGLDQIRRRHGLHADMDDYRRCGNHPDTDLARI